MRKTYLYLFGVSLALATAASPTELAAQDDMSDEAGPPIASQQAIIDGWTSSQRLAYQAWPAATKDYFWTLSETRQKLFWGLTEQDRLTITSMSGPEREQAWRSLEARAGETAAWGPTDGT